MRAIDVSTASGALVSAESTVSASLVKCFGFIFDHTTTGTVVLKNKSSAGGTFARGRLTAEMLTLEVFFPAPIQVDTDIHYNISAGTLILFVE
jgi:hypothetical protein